MKRPATLLTLVALAATATACASSGASEGGTSPSPEPTTAAPPPTQAAAPPPSPAAAELPSYTAEQAERGHAEFRATCYDCHYSSEFKGSDFQYEWGRRSVADLYQDIVENMPDDDPGSLTEQQYVDVVAYILQLNGFPAGSTELSADEEVMAAWKLKAPMDKPAR